jgi:putative phosphoribosyl transferase
MKAATPVKDVGIPLDGHTHAGLLGIPAGARGIVVFVHGSGSSRLSPRNNYVAEVLRDAGMATLLFDLLTEMEDRDYERRFDIDLLTRRIKEVSYWLQEQEATRNLMLGYFGASTGAAAALRAAAAPDSPVAAIASRGGRPDLAGDALPKVRAPVLLLVGGEDHEVIELNRQAAALLRAPHEMVIIPGATHLFEEPGTLEQVAARAGDWFMQHFTHH